MSLPRNEHTRTCAFVSAPNNPSCYLFCIKADPLPHSSPSSFVTPSTSLVRIGASLLKGVHLPVSKSRRMHAQTLSCNSTGVSLEYSYPFLPHVMVRFLNHQDSCVAVLSNLFMALVPPCNYLRFPCASLPYPVRYLPPLLCSSFLAVAFGGLFLPP